MSVTRTRLRNYVQLFVPTKDRRGRSLSAAAIRRWQAKAEAVFRRFVRGFYVSPCYTLSGHFLSSDVGWMTEPNYVIKAFAPKTACERLLRSLEDEIVEPMGVALAQESIAIESSLEGLVIYEIHS